MATELTWTTLKFGKHEGKTLPQVVLSDPDWFYWAVGNKIFRGPLAEEAHEIARKACTIKIPKPDPENWRVGYAFSLDDKFVDFSIIDAKDAGSGSEYSEISSHLDLSLPRRMKTYDKFGCRLMLAKFRQCYFGGLNLTKERCERFFYDDRNFI